MSHFSVLVVGDDPEKQLAPYHEFECTGTVDEYVQSIDKTDEIRAEYEANTRTMVELPDGTLLGRSDKRFYRKPTPEEQEKIGTFAGTGSGGGITYASRDWGDGEGYSTRVRDISLLEGAVEVEKKVKEVMTFAEFVEYWHGDRPIVKPGEEPGLEGDHQWGWMEVDEDGEITKVIRRTNPNAKWDWYQVGGRWTGYFPLKEGASGVKGSPGLMTAPAKGHVADQVRWGDVDIEAARRKEEEEADARFALWEQCFQKHRSEHGGDPKPFSHFREEHEDIDKARKAYHEQDAIVDYGARLKEQGGFLWGSPIDDMGFDREAYIERRSRKALVPFAVVKDGKWHQKGEMGWWGCVSDEKPEEDWVAGVTALFDDLPPDTLVTAVDCHI